MPKIKSLRLIFAWAGSITACMLAGGAIHAQLPADQNQAVTEIIRLQHRTPATIRDAIAPHLDPRGAISQIDNSLVISTSRANLTQLQQMIEDLDTPLRRIKLSVDFAYDQQPSSFQPPSDVVSGTATETEPPARQSIVITEGESAWFQSNSSAPVVVPSFNEYQSGSTDSFNDALGLGATVELRDNRVILRTAMTQSDTGEVSPELQNRLLHATIELEPGQWFILNEPAEEDVSLSDTTGNAEQNLLAVQVELL